MTILAALGALTYNGYSFDGTSKVNVSVEFVSDDSGRTVLYHRHVIHVTALVQGNTGTAAEMLSIRQMLGEQGRELVFTGRGFGDDLIVNAGAGGLRDVKWGPKPKIIRWEPVANANCGEIEWEIETCVPICDTGVQRWIGLMALNYDIDFQIDERGYTTRTIAGYLEIAQTRLGRTVPDSADQYLNYYTTTVPSGFHRSQSRHLSSDKSRLEFSITDKQIPSPNAFPPGVVDIQCRHRAGRRRGSGMVRNTITCDIEMAADWPTAHAMVIFSAIANRRLNIARAASGIATSTSGGQTNAQGFVLIDEFQIEEDLFSRRSSFSVSYHVPISLQEFFCDAVGLWQPLPTNWTSWHASVANAQSVRGYAGLQHRGTDDQIKDLCLVPSQLSHALSQNPNANPPRPVLPVVRNVRPDAKNSWLKYTNRIKTFRDRAVVRQRILQAKDYDQLPFEVNGTTGMAYPAKAGTDDIIQEGARSSYYVEMQGRAARAGWEIPRPKYGTIGTEAATEIGGEFEQAITGNWFGVPIYQAIWNLRYALPNSPGSVTLLANPREHLNGNGTAAS